jgi:putative ABC transport system permease protein
VGVGILVPRPLPIRLVALTARRRPVPPRRAGRDLARYQARSGAALAAISLGLGIAVALVVAAAAAAPTPGEGNLSDRQLLVRLGAGGDLPVVPEISAVELGRKRTELDRFAAPLHDATVLPLQAAAPNARETTRGRVVRPVASLARRVGPRTFREVGRLYVATPALLARLGIEPSSIRPDTDVLAAATGDVRIVGTPSATDLARPVVQAIEIPTYTSLPHAVVTEHGLRRFGLAPVVEGWLVEAGSPFTPAQLAESRSAAAAAGLAVEARSGEDDLRAIRTGATAGGMLLALGVLAMTVGLIRAEAGRDLRTLAATGATRTTRRALTAATAGGLGFLGAVLGIGGAYLALVAGYLDKLDALGRPPYGELVVTLVGVPLVAVIAGWLLAGREPPVLSRAALD